MTFFNNIIQPIRRGLRSVLLLACSLILGVIVTSLLTKYFLGLKDQTITDDYVALVTTIGFLITIVIIIIVSFSYNLKEEQVEKKPIIVQEEKKSKADVTNIASTEEGTTASYAYDTQVSLKRRDVLNTFKITEERILREIQNLKKWAKVNLVIGVLITIGGIGILFAFILWGQDDINKVADTISFARLSLYWVSKLCLVIFVEIFAFFFLRMYKENMESVKYYHNELTSIESRKKSMLFAILQGGEEDLTRILFTLGNIDRNYILHKDQTTVELEKMRITNETMKEQIENMWNVLKSVLSIKDK